MTLVAVVFTILVIMWSTSLVRRLTSFRTRSSSPSLPVPTSVPPARIACRILFVTRVGDELVLDCVAATDHPSRSQALSGSPFTMEVSAFGSCWFADSMERFLVRLAAEDRVVSFELDSGPEGERLDVRSDATRMRFDLHNRVGLG